MSALLFGAAQLALRSGLRLKYSHLGQRSSLSSVSMKVAVANSSEMIWSNPNQLISALSRSFVPVFFFANSHQLSFCQCSPNAI